jgi:hypothetical protein
MLIDASRGTVLWAINQFRSAALGALVADLSALEERGLHRKECDKVQDGLSDVVAVAATVPTGTYWQGSVYEEFERFQRAYFHWNDHEKSDDGPARRRAALAALRNRRKAISRRIALHQVLLLSHLKLETVKEMYKPLQRIASDMPELFPKLRTATGRFTARLVP